MREIQDTRAVRVSVEKYDRTITTPWVYFGRVWETTWPQIYGPMIIRWGDSFIPYPDYMRVISRLVRETDFASQSAIEEINDYIILVERLGKAGPKPNA